MGSARRLETRGSQRHVRRAWTRTARNVTTLTFREFAEVYKQRHVQAKGLANAGTIDYRLKSLVDRFGDRALQDVKTADIEDFIADLKLPRVVNRRHDLRHEYASRLVERASRSRRPGQSFEFFS